MKIKCPQCSKDTIYDTKNPFRPFCSERCKWMDLGDWAQENYRVPSKEPVSEEELIEAYKKQEDKE